MNPIITHKQNKEIVRRQKLYDLYDGSYTRDLENAQTRFITANILDGDTECAKLLNITAGLFKKVVDKYIYGVGAPRFETEIETDKIVKSLLITGIAGVELVGEGNSKAIDYVDGDELFEESTEEGNKIILIRRLELQQLKDKNQFDYYIFKKEYNKGYNENFLYKADGPCSVEGRQIELSDIPQTEGLQEREETGLEGFSIVLIEQDSTVEMIRSLVYAIERKLVEYNTQVVKFGKQKIFGKGVSPKEMKVFLEEDSFSSKDSNASIEYISNENPYIELMSELIKDELRLLSSMTQISIESFGFDVSSNLGLDAQEAKKEDFVSAVTSIRDEIDSAVKILYGDEVVISWRKVGYVLNKETVEMLALAKNEGLMTQVDAISRLLNINEEEAEKKILLMADNEQDTTDT